MSIYNRRVARVAVNRTSKGIATSLEIANFTPGYSKTEINFFEGNDKEPIDKERVLMVSLPSLPRNMSLHGGQYPSHAKASYMGYISIEDAVKLVFDTAKTDSTLEEKITSLSHCAKSSLTPLVDDVLKILVLNRQLPYLVPPTDVARDTKYKILIYAKGRTAKVKGKDKVITIDEFIACGMTRCFEKMHLHKAVQAIEEYKAHSGAQKQNPELENEFSVAAKIQEERRRKSSSPRPAFRFTKAKMRRTIKVAAALLGIGFLAASSYIGYWYSTFKQLEREHGYGVMAVDSAIEGHELRSACAELDRLEQVCSTLYSRDKHTLRMYLHSPSTGRHNPHVDEVKLAKELIGKIEAGADDDSLLIAMPLINWRDKIHPIESMLLKYPGAEKLNAALAYVTAISLARDIEKGAYDYRAPSYPPSDLSSLIASSSKYWPQIRRKCLSAWSAYFNRKGNDISLLIGIPERIRIGSNIMVVSPEQTEAINEFFEKVYPLESYVKIRYDAIMRDLSSGNVRGARVRWELAQLRLIAPHSNYTLLLEQVVAREGVDKKSGSTLERLYKEFEKEAPLAAEAIMNGRTEQYVNNKLDRLNRVLVGDSYDSLPPEHKEMIINLEIQYLKQSAGVDFTSADQLIRLGRDPDKLRSLEDFARKALEKYRRYAPK